MVIFFKREGSESVSFFECLSRNAGIMPDSITDGGLYRHKVQAYYDELVSKGIISFVTMSLMENKEHYLKPCLLFKVEGYEELQKVSILYFDTDQMTIEDLLINASEKNNIKFPVCLKRDPDSNTYLHDAIPALCFTAAAALYPLTGGVPLAVAVTLTATAFVADQKVLNNEMIEIDRPKQRF